VSPPGVPAGEEVGEQGREDAELVAPGVAQDPELPATFGLMIPAGGAEGFEPGDFGFDVVSFQVQVHPLQCGAYVRRRKTGFLRWVAFATFLTIHALRFVAARRGKRGEPTVQHSTVVAVPQPRYEVILVSGGCRRRLRGRRRSS
jgi:hypothetical protein